MAMEAYNLGSRHLPPLQIGDSIRVQNQTATRTTKWDRTGVITDILSGRKYEVMMDGSHRLSICNRRHLRKISKPNSQEPRPPPQEEEVTIKEDDDDEEEQDLGSLQEPETPSTPVTPAPALIQPPAPDPVMAPSTPEPRGSSKTRNCPDRLEVTGTRKLYAEAVREGRPGPPGKGDVTQRDGRRGSPFSKYTGPARCHP